MTSTTPVTTAVAHLGPDQRRSRGRPRRSLADRRSNVLTLGMLALLVYFLLPLFWLVVASTKTTADLFSSFGLWFSNDFSLLSNIRETFTYDDGVFLRWMLNTMFYSVVSAVGAAFLAALGGYGFAKYRFRGNNALFASCSAPSWCRPPPWPFRRTCCSARWAWSTRRGRSSCPRWSARSASTSCASTRRTPSRTASSRPPASTGPASSASSSDRPAALAPGLVTVLLFTLVATWNNYFLPLIMLNNPNLYPITVGLASWSSQAVGGGGSTGELLALVVTGSMLSVVPLVVAFLLLQRYWQSGLAAGGVKG